MKNKKIIILILVITFISYIVFAFAPIEANRTYAAVPAGTLTDDINTLDESSYPGFKSLIQTMQSQHSNYRFLLYYTGLKWDEVLTTEYQSHGTSPLNLFQYKSNYEGMWVCPICGTARFDNGSWCCASLEALAYMIDPRNSLNDSDVFQFKDLEGSDVTYDDIARVVSRYGAFINNPEAIQAIVDASAHYNVNGYFLVAKIINEHGQNGSTLSNGNGYQGRYVGCYNYFNIGSYGSGTANIINSGLEYAQKSGWTSIRNSIFGGTAIVKEKYITTYNQNTLYYQKFNVSGKSSLGSHQYQQNIMAAQTQGSSLKSYYGSNISSNNFTFIIPIYENMPQTACPRPNTTVQNTINYEDGVVQHISTSLKVRASGSINSVAIGALNNGEQIKILKRATTQVDGYYWDLIVSNKNGTYGYVARIIGGDEVIAGTGSGGSSSGGQGSAPDSVPPQAPTLPDQSGDTTVITGDNNFKVSDTTIQVLPNISYESLKAKYADAIVTDQAGNPVASGNIATGYKATIGGKTYALVKKGDANGDGNVNVLDTVLILNAIKGEKTLQNEYKEAACAKNISSFNVTDVVLILNYIKGTAQLGL